MTNSERKVGRRPFSGSVHEARTQLVSVETLLDGLRIKYEQYFAGILQREPLSEHQQLIREFRGLHKAPAKSSALNFHLRSIESRYQSYNTYWQRILKEREEGTYKRDIFKADLRDGYGREKARSQTAEGEAEREIHELFADYKAAVSAASISGAALNISRVEEVIRRTAHSWSLKNGGKKPQFRVLSEGKKVTIRLIDPDG
jgi:hypothetical protein